MSAPVSAALARFVAQSRWADIPDEIRRAGKRAMLNAAGCIIAGRRDSAVALVRRCFPDEDALLDAAAATAHDYDDTHLATVIHATPPVAGVVFSLARRSPVTGRDALHAFILGVETSCRIGNAVTPGHYERGWHITSTCGIFGATLAAAKLLGLSEPQTVCALGIAATQAAGLVEMLGSMARVLNAGFAARNAIGAARLAATGFQGPAAPLEGLRGFVNVFGGAARLSEITDGLGSRWELKNVALKPYPSGVVLHALIDACLEHREALRRAESIVVRMNPLAIERTDRPEPRNAIEARLSAQHAVAVVLLHGRAGLDEFGDAAALDPRVRELRRRVRVVSEASLDKMAASISAEGNDIAAPASRPMDDARLEAKFLELAGEEGAELAASLRGVEDLEAFSPP